MTINAEKSGEDSNQSGHDIYSDPKLAQTKIEDPIQEFLAQNWKNLSATVLAVLVGIYFIQSFKESYETSMRASADIFQRLQLSYKEYERLNEELSGLSADGKTPDAAKSEEIKKKLADTKSLMEQLSNSAADSREPYSKLSQVYKAAINRTDNPTLSKEILKPLSEWKNIGKEGSTERLNSELAAIQLGRLQLQSPEEAAKGRELIKDLTLNAEFTAVTAAKILAGFAVSDSEKAEAKSTIEALLKKQPEQAELLRDTLKDL